LVIVSWLIPAPAKGAACCTSATISGAGRLKIWEDSALGVSSSWANSIGSWNAEGEWNAFDETYRETVWLSKVWAIARVRDDLELSLVLPWVMTTRAIPNESSSGQGLGHSRIGLRYEAIAIGQYRNVPGLALLAGVTIPTGVRGDEATDTLLRTAATARGDWAASVAVSLEYAHLPWFVKLDAGRRHFLAYTHAEHDGPYQLAGLWQLTLSSGLEVIDDILIFAFSLGVETQGESHLDHREQTSSSRFSCLPSVSMSWQVNPHLALLSTLSRGIAVNELGMNTNGALTASLGVRYGHF